MQNDAHFTIAAGDLPPPPCLATIRFPQRGGLVKLEVGIFTALAQVPAKALGGFLAHAKEVLERHGYTTRLTCILPLALDTDLH
ncbi:hypothetical protein HYW17_02710 [Candidatus Uhrbacteria bacterium]|nr:hypothetical protein [Candidatus Uhrbacteria bacterium]